MTRLIRGAHKHDVVTGILEPGTRIGDYKVIDAIAVGGFGTVYRVEHTMLGRQAALKILHRELGSTSDAARRFEREAKAVNIIQHPNVVDVFDFGYLPDGQPYFVMELLTGEDLQTHIEGRGRLTLEETIATLEPLCSALDAAHAHGIIHRDIKASNVFRHERPQGPRIVLLDFGVAKLLFDASNSPATSSQIALGTPACMAPEQIVGREVSARTDIYALGALTFHMLTGGLPFSDSNITMMQQMHMHAQRPRVSSIVPALQALDDVIAKAMSRNIDERYGAASELLDAVRSRAVVSRTSTGPRPRLQRGVGVHLEILVATAHLEEPDEHLLDAIEAIGTSCATALRPAGFDPVLDASTTVLFVRALDADVDETSAVADTIARLRDIARLRSDPRIAISLVVHVDAVLASRGVAKGGALLQLASWVPVNRVAGIVAHRAIVDGLDVKLESLDGDLVRVVE